jgi:hypothetical protein
MTPAVALCAACGKEFKVSMEDLKRTSAAQESLQRQFDEHECGGGEP